MINDTESPDHSFFTRFEILSGVKLCVVIPVKDEEAYILKNLTAFAMQVDLSGKPVKPEEFEILVLANNCSDHSAARIKEFQRNHPHMNIYLEEAILPSHQANIGYVRRKLMECAYTRLLKNGGGIILTTDGDTTVAKDWISQTQREINNGAEAVGGRIFLYDDELECLDNLTRTCHFKDERYQLLIAELESKIIGSAHDPYPRHHQHFNGSFAITTDCYKKSGGIPVVDDLEDCAFFDRLQNIDAKIRHSLKVRVHTSARYLGRVTVGLSSQLNMWKNPDHFKNFTTESFHTVSNRLIKKKMLMDLWESKNRAGFNFNQSIKNIIPEIDVNEEIYHSFNDHCYFGAWYEEILKLYQTHHLKKYPKVPIDTAIQDLETELKHYPDHRFSQTSIL